MLCVLQGFKKKDLKIPKNMTKLNLKKKKQRNKNKTKPWLKR